LENAKKKQDELLATAAKGLAEVKTFGARITVLESASKKVVMVPSAPVACMAKAELEKLRQEVAQLQLRHATEAEAWRNDTAAVRTETESALNATSQMIASEVRRSESMLGSRLETQGTRLTESVAAVDARLQPLQHRLSTAAGALRASFLAANSGQRRTTYLRNAWSIWFGFVRKLHQGRIRANASIQRRRRETLMIAFAAWNREAVLMRRRQDRLQLTLSTIQSTVRRAQRGALQRWRANVEERPVWVDHAGLEARVVRAETSAAEATRQLAASVDLKAEQLSVNAVAARVDGLSRACLTARESSILILNVLTKSLEAIGDFTIRRGSPCLSCGQALPSCNAPDVSALGPGDKELVSSPDLISVGFVYGTLQQICAHIFQYAQTSKANAVLESNAMYGNKELSLDDEGVSTSCSSTPDRCFSKGAPVPPLNPMFKVPTLAQAMNSRDRLPAVKERSPQTARGRPNMSRTSMSPRVALTRRPASATSRRQGPPRGPSSRFTTPR